MKKEDLSSGLNRRDFLKAACVMTGGIIVYPSLPFTPSCKAPFKTGVLLPGSRIYPDLVHNLLAGMKLYLEHSGKSALGRTVELVTMDIGYSPSASLRHARILIEEDRCDLVVAYINNRAAAQLRDLCHEKKILLIAANAGQNLIRREEESPYIFHASLNCWQANWSLGLWAARNLGTRGVVATSFFDSGYDALNAFRLGFEHAGGKILRTWVTGSPVSPDVTLKKIFRETKRLHPDFIHASYCGQKAVHMVKAYSDAKLSGKVPLIGSGFLVDEGNLPAQGESALGIKSVFSWSDSLNTEENKTFISAFKGTTGKRADAFALLGYDTARLIGEALKATGGKTTTGVLREAFRAVQFESPRGPISIHPDTHCMTGPLYIREVMHHGGRLCNRVIRKLDSISEMDRSIQGMRDSLTSGWTNFYMSV